MSSRLFWKLLVTFGSLHVVSTLLIFWNLPGEVRADVWWVGALSTGLAVAATAGLAVHILGPVRMLTKATEKMARGTYRDPIYVNATDELGQLAHAFNVLREDMNRRLTQLRETNQQLSAVLGGMTDGVIAIDENRDVLFANRAAGELMRFTPSEAKGRPLLESVRSHKLHDLVTQVLAHPGQQQLEFEWGKTGERRLLVIATSFSAQPSTGIVMVIHNLSEVRQLEAMRRDFVANVSHELRTPLSSIKAYAETLSQGAINDEKHRLSFVKQIEEQSDRLGQLINDLLSLARIEAGNEHMRILKIPIDRVVKLCIQEQRRAAEEKQLQLVVDPGPETHVSADEDALRQILINLIDNAVKYTAEKGRITVGWRTADGKVTIYVQDTGIGIPSDMRDRVFERFFRVDKARSREVGGTGLGLAIVKHLSQNLGGSVVVESELDRGSKFTVTLPAA